MASVPNSLFRMPWDVSEYFVSKTFSFCSHYFLFMLLLPSTPCGLWMGKKYLRRFCNRAGMYKWRSTHAYVEVMWCVCNEVKPFFNYIYLTRPTLCNWYCQIGRRVYLFVIFDFCVLFRLCFVWRWSLVNCLLSAKTLKLISSQGRTSWEQAI